MLTEGNDLLHNEVAGIIAVGLGCTTYAKFGDKCNSFVLRQPFLGPWPAVDGHLATWLEERDPLPYGIVVVGGAEAALFEEVKEHGWFARLVTFGEAQIILVEELTEIG